MFNRLTQKVPKKIRTSLRKYFYQVIFFGFTYHPKEGLTSLKRKIFFYFLFSPQNRKKYQNEIQFIIKKAKPDFSYSYIFPYNFIFNYDYKKIEIFFDEKKELFYVMHNERRLYYNKKYKTEDEVRIQYYCICIEQDENSPHKYTDDSKFKINKNDVVLDIGSAEGNFALDFIEEIKHLYLFEASEDWKIALEATFEPWKDKVTIINKYVSNMDNENCVTLDSVLGDKVVNVIKIDVEGAEFSILEKSNTVLSNLDLKLFVCTYHKQEDASQFEKLFKSLGFVCSFTEGFMIFPLTKLKPPYFRKGLIRATNII